ncbi:MULTISPECIES: hypothetical protein [unclassified Chelatococcus]|uniref:hypothetical protein n=1 Tax=unclassified Chelatococcus TaxID=2638111 RepID=UPI001BD10B78|nr:MULTISPECIES: hypothetical protein [unclassified Chelatococcus]MBS7695920.1 hypothetical protein [Chelatococcus sp. YT9]MBX3555705.1 hypothetical protein [Chelatococcus sp.]
MNGIHSQRSACATDAALLVDTTPPQPAIPSSAKTAAEFLPSRLVTLMRQAITTTGLDLTGLSVLTEAATGAYAVTPVIAAMAGAREVNAVARSSRHGSVGVAHAAVEALAQAAGVSARISLLDHVPEDRLGSVDIVTNSGHLRPLGASLIERLPPTAVIALMFEAWEFRPDDIAREACRSRGIPIVGVNERHPAVDVFAFLGPLAAALLRDAGVTLAGSRIAVICDNPFGLYLLQGLADVDSFAWLFPDVRDMFAADWDAVVVALRPSASMRLDEHDARHLAELAPEACIAQFWGDIDRAAFADAGLTVWPRQAPRPGHMGILLSALGPEPIVRLQTGGLRAAEWIRRGGNALPGGFAQMV